MRAVAFVDVMEPHERVFVPFGYEGKHKIYNGNVKCFELHCNIMSNICSFDAKLVLLFQYFHSFSDFLSVFNPISGFFIFFSAKQQISYSQIVENSFRVSTQTEIAYNDGDIDKPPTRFL